MGTRMQCQRCQAEVIVLATFTGHHKTFDAVEHDGTIEGYEGARWYVTRQRGAVSGDQARGVPRGAPYLTVHNCKWTRIGAGVGQLRTGDEISQHDGPRPRDLVLRDGFRYDYRWASHWAHIVENVVSRSGMCGATIPTLEKSERERERVEHMPVCETCLLWYGRRAAFMAKSDVAGRKGDGDERT